MPSGWRGWILASVGLTVALAPGVAAHDGIHARLARLDEVIAEQPERPELYVRRADLYRRHQQPTLAWADLRRALALPGGRDAARFEMALLSQDLGWLQLARRTIAEHLADHPADAKAHELHGGLLNVLGRSREAEVAYQRAIDCEAAPDPDLLLAAVATLRSRGESGQRSALALIDKSLAQFGAQVSLQLEAVALEANLGLFDEALARIDELLAESPRSERWLARRGDLLRDAGREEAARVAYMAAQRAFHEGGRRRSHTASAEALRRHIADQLNTLLKTRAAVVSPPRSRGSAATTNLKSITKDRVP